jgi:hypothetical protein
MSDYMSDTAVHQRVTVSDRDHGNGWCCSDCLMLLANGETPPEMNETETAIWLAKIEARSDDSHVTIGRLLGEDSCDCTDWDTDHHRYQCEERTFSWSTCDVCGSALGGYRAAVTFWYR